MPNTGKASGLDQETMQKMAQERTEASKQSDSGETQKDISSQEDTQGQEQNDTAQNENSGETETDANSDELVSFVKNTFGFSEDEIDDRVLKVAKSVKESQREFNKFYNNEFQPVKKKAEAFENFDSFLQSQPDLLEQIQNRAKGNKENPSQSENHTVNSNKGKLDDDLDVDEKKLIQEGYVDQTELDSLDELARERKLLRAEAKYIREHGLKEYQNKLRDTYQQEQTRIEKERQQQEAKRKYNKSFDNFLDEYPEVDFSDPQYNQHLDKINEMTARLIDVEDDPFKTSAEVVLGKQGKLPQKNQTRPKQPQEKLDSGVSISKGRQQQQTQAKDPVDEDVERHRQKLKNIRKSRFE